MIKISILFLFIKTNIFSTNDSLSFLKYHENVNSAELLLANHKTEEAFQSYISAFKILKPATEDLLNAAIVASLNKNNEYAEAWLNQAFSRNLDLKVATKRKIITQFLGKKRIKEIHKRADRSKININLRNSIDSLIVIDQQNRKGKGVLNKSIDIQNASFLLNIIKTVGFPSDEVIGYGNSIDLLFMHNLSFWLEENNHKILKAQLFNGNVSPELYALLKDRKQLFNTKFKERYYYLPYSYLGANSRTRKNFSVIEIDKYVNTSLIPEIDNRRQQIGLNNVADSQKVNEKSFSQKYGLIIPMKI